MINRCLINSYVHKKINYCITLLTTIFSLDSHTYTFEHKISSNELLTRVTCLLFIRDEWNIFPRLSYFHFYVCDPSTFDLSVSSRLPFLCLTEHWSVSAEVIFMSLPSQEDITNIWTLPVTLSCNASHQVDRRTDDELATSPSRKSLMPFISRAR